MKKRSSVRRGLQSARRYERVRRVRRVPGTSLTLVSFLFGLRPSAFGLAFAFCLLPFALGLLPWASGLTSLKELRSPSSVPSCVSVLISDLKHAVRQLWQRPIFTISVVLTLAIGIGVNAVAFTVVNGLLFTGASIGVPHGMGRIVTTPGADEGGNGSLPDTGGTRRPRAARWISRRKGGCRSRGATRA